MKFFWLIMSVFFITLTFISLNEHSITEKDQKVVVELKVDSLKYMEREIQNLRESRPEIALRMSEPETLHIPDTIRIYETRVDTVFVTQEWKWLNTFERFTSILAKGISHIDTMATSAVSIFGMWQFFKSRRKED